jgi:hypothetical protein
MASSRIAPHANPDVFEGWPNYPTNLNHYDPVTTGGLGLKRKIDDLSGVLFDEDVKVRVIDIREEVGALPIPNWHEYTR